MLMVFLEGVAFPLDKLNENGWGVPASEADRAISFLRNAVVRICPRDSGHGCDFSESPNHEIGRVIAAWRTESNAHVRVQITDSIASQKISDGVWEPTWSVYGKADTVKDGWAHGFQARSLTLVRDPAWKEAKFRIAASNGAETSLINSESYVIITESDIGDIIMADKTNETKPDTTEMTALVAENQKLKEDLGSLKASFDKLKEERDNASLAAASGVPADKFNEMVEERAKRIAASTMEQWKEEQAKTAATQKYTRAAMSAGLEPDTTLLKNLSADQIHSLAASYERLAPMSTMRHNSITYPSDSSTMRSSVGRWNETKKIWEDF